MSESSAQFWARFFAPRGFRKQPAMFYEVLQVKARLDVAIGPELMPLYWADFKLFTRGYVSTIEPKLGVGSELAGEPCKGHWRAPVARGVCQEEKVEK